MATLTKTENGFQDQLSLNAGQKHSSILSTSVKLPFVIKIFVLSIFQRLFYTDFIVLKRTISMRQNVLKLVDKKFFSFTLNLFCLSGPVTLKLA